MMDFMDFWEDREYCVGKIEAEDAWDTAIEEMQIKYQNLTKEYKLISKSRDILVMHMAEVKAISDGSKENTLKDVVEHCLEELTKLHEE